ncbi:ComEA family DNA-binding protein [Psychrobacter sanguinis]|nr:helix-hairpin-helix domain-containing protein [Psychrobacter sanguinis]
MSYRQAFGDFARVEDLTKVKGIGDKTVSKNRDRMTVN